MKLWKVILLLSTVYSATYASQLCDVLVTVVSQNSRFHSTEAAELCQSIDEQSILLTTQSVKCMEVPELLQGYWAYWPSFSWILDSYECSWYLFVPSDADVNVGNILTFLERKNKSSLDYYGYGLVDQSLTIIHHFYGYDRPKDAPPLLYPDFSAGLLLPSELMKRSAHSLIESPFKQRFAIDAQHELARFFFEEMGTSMVSHPNMFCSLGAAETCAVVYRNSSTLDTESLEKVSLDDVFVAIKTFSGYHRSRVVVIKRTWTRDLPNIEYVSDVEDKYVPTVASGVTNTEKGHCGKTFAILQRFLEKPHAFKWLLIADDDTLMSIPRLLRLLGKYSSTEQLILGERYGFGFSVTGDSGYDYPTGGAGMVFSRSAVEKLVEVCSCPKDDSPDDMILGMCARNSRIPIIHSPAFHQAKVKDYAADYIRKIAPISFHKFEETDPYRDFLDYLDEEYQYRVITTADNLHNEL